MPQFHIHTYSGLIELRQIQEEMDVFPFVFSETKDLLESDPNICIDISTVIHFLRTSKDNRYPAYLNIREITENTKVIVEVSLVEEAISYFPDIFVAGVPYYPKESTKEDTEFTHMTFKNTRKTIYTYNNVDDLNAILEYTDEHMIPIATFSRATGSLQSELEKFNKSAKLALLDLTSTSYAIEDNKNLIYSIEQFVNQFGNIEMIILNSQVDKIIKYFPLYVEMYDSIDKLLPGLGKLDSAIDINCETKKVTSLSSSELAEFIDKFNHNIIGHEFFKERFKYCLKNFITLNKVKEQKVLSIFLFGISGVGKTEVARQIANGLIQDCYLPKINFQNYSSQDALNSLIGSPAGYIGCEHGELSDKIKKSKVGLILCDEFEKTTKPVFSFFLELLEDGRFTDSMAREYELDGYIIIFTSNIHDEAEYKKIMPMELQTRFDLVCEFQEPSYDEKTKFLDLLFEQAERKFTEQFGTVQMTPSEKRQLYNFDYLNLRALRDIKRVFNNRLMDYFVSKDT